MRKRAIPPATWIALGSYLLAVAGGVLIGAEVAIGLAVLGTVALTLGAAGTTGAQRQIPSLGRLPGVLDHGFTTIRRDALAPAPPSTPEAEPVEELPPFEPPLYAEAGPRIEELTPEELNAVQGFPTATESLQKFDSDLERCLVELTEDISELLRLHQVRGDDWLVERTRLWAGRADGALEDVRAGDLVSAFRKDGVYGPHDATQYILYLHRQAAAFRDALKTLRPARRDSLF